MTRIIDVTSGERQYVVGQVTELNGKSLTAATFKVGLGTRTTPPTSWDTPDVATVTGATAMVSLLVDSTGQTGEEQRLWVRVIDNPETYDLACVNEAIEVR